MLFTDKQTNQHYKNITSLCQGGNKSIIYKDQQYYTYYWKKYTLGYYNQSYLTLYNLIATGRNVRSRSVLPFTGRRLPWGSTVICMHGVVVVVHNFDNEGFCIFVIYTLHTICIQLQTVCIHYIICQVYMYVSITRLFNWFMHRYICYFTHFIMEFCDWSF